MNYEKAYNEALERFKAFKEKYYTKDTYFGDVIFDKTGEMQKDFESIFPQPQESENERIRKALMEVLHRLPTSIFDGSAEGGYLGATKEQMLAYLEKQKELQLMNGYADLYFDEWNKQQRNPTKRQCFEEGIKYAQRLQKGQEPVEHWQYVGEVDLKENREEEKPNIELIQKSWYMEGYNDRKFNKEPKWIIKTGEGGPRYEENPKYGQHIEKQDYSGLNDFERAIHRGFLCAGVENVPVNIIKETAQDCLAHLPVEWSEDFDKEVENVHKRYPEVSYAKLTRIAYHFSKWASRCKGIKWSEEDEKIYTFVYDFFENCWWSTSWEISREQALKMLNSLRHQPKQEWGEKDEEMLNDLCEELLDLKRGNYHCYTKDVYDEWITWLKALRPSWKPNEELMGCFERLIAFKNPAQEDIDGCEKLYEQLKKL